MPLFILSPYLSPVRGGGGLTSALLLPLLLHDPVYDRTVRLLPRYAKPAEAMGAEYIPMILSLQWIIGFEKTSEISSEIAAEFGFFPESTKVKARRACANIFRRLNRGYYTVARRYEFYVRVAGTISHERAQRTSEILFLPREHKIHIFELACNVLFII